MITGNGDVLEPEQGICPNPVAVARLPRLLRALFENLPPPEQIVKEGAGDRRRSQCLRNQESHISDRWHGMPGKQG